MASHDPSSPAKIDVCAIVEGEQLAVGSWPLAKPANAPPEIANYELQITNPEPPPRRPGSVLIPWIFAAAEGMTRKLQGEQAECAFVWRAMEQGLIVSKPYGDSAPYDFIVQRRLEGRKRRGKGVKPKASKWNPRGRYLGRPFDAQLWRIQVKSTRTKDHKGRYFVNLRHCASQPYVEGQIDFFAAWVEPEDAWYIIPAEAVIPATCAHLAPHRRGRGRLEKYREAWALLA